MATFKKVGTIGTFHTPRWSTGMTARGYERDFAEACFRQIEGFGTYGFPESHAASFALLVYASAWMKCRFPDVFACALLNAQPMGFYAPAQIIRDAREHGVEAREVDVNFSGWDNSLEALRLRPPAAASAPRCATARTCASDTCGADRLSPDQGRARGRHAPPRGEARAAAMIPCAIIWLRTGLSPERARSPGGRGRLSAPSGSTGAMRSGPCAA